jgi:hypothetical protein
MKQLFFFPLLLFVTFALNAQPALHGSLNGNGVGSNYSFSLGFEVITRVTAWQPVYIYNYGFSDAYLGDPSTWTLTGDLSQFDIDSSLFADTLAPGDTTVIYMRFKPTSIGSKCMWIAIPTNDPSSYNNPFVLVPCGYGADPDISVHIYGVEIPTGGSFNDFYTVPVGYQTYPFDFWIKANGTAHGITLYNSPKIEKVSGNVADFVIDESMTASFIDVYNDTKFSIIFKPLTTGKKSMVVRIRNSDSNEGDFTFTVYAKTGSLRGNGRTGTDQYPMDDAEIESEVEIVAFPNPSNRTFTVWTGGLTDEKVSARVFSSTGTAVENHLWTGAKHEVIGGEWKAGLYLLEVHNSEGRKIVKLLKE